MQFGRKHNLKDFSQDICNDYHKESYDLYKKILEEEYYITYAFAMLYGKGNELLPHLDLIQNEISATTCYLTGRDYPIYISKKYIENNYSERNYENIDNIKNEDKIELNIQFGDIEFFNVRNYLHFREKLEEDINYKGILTQYSKTVLNSEELRKKVKKKPYLNSSGCPLYK